MRAAQRPTSFCWRPLAAALPSCPLSLSRRSLAPLLLATSFAPPALAASPPPLSLFSRLERGQLDKAFFQTPPSVQAFPDWLEGEWNVILKFASFSFPSEKISKARLAADRDVPGFLRLSIAPLADVGSGGVYRQRWMRSARGEVIEDRSHNLAASINGLLAKQVVDLVDYSPAAPNRITVRLIPGASNNAERLELYVNARESTAPADNTRFAASECVRQVALGYSTQYNAPRVAVTDYTTSAVYRRAEGVSDVVDVSLLTAGYIQPNEALQYSSEPGQPPMMNRILELSTKPVVLYRHSMRLTRVPAG